MFYNFKKLYLKRCCMDTLMLVLQFIVLLAAIFLGVRLGGIAIGYAGGLGVVVLSLALGMEPGVIPWDVILIIMSVIACGSRDVS